MPSTLLYTHSCPKCTTGAVRINKQDKTAECLSCGFSRFQKPITDNRVIAECPGSMKPPFNGEIENKHGICTYCGKYLEVQIKGLRGIRDYKPLASLPQVVIQHSNLNGRKSKREAYRTEFHTLQ